MGPPSLISGTGCYIQCVGAVEALQGAVSLSKLLKYPVKLQENVSAALRMSLGRIAHLKIFLLCIMSLQDELLLSSPCDMEVSRVASKLLLDCTEECFREVLGQKHVQHAKAMSALG